MAATSSESSLSYGEMPSYFDCLRDSYWAFEKLFSESTKTYNYGWDFFSDVHRAGSIKMSEIGLCLLMAVVWTLIRIVLTAAVFRTLPFGMINMKAENQGKFAESLFKFLYYTSTWSVSAYLLIIDERYPFFYHPNQVWNDWRLLMRIPDDIQTLYLVQCSFYLHSIYATLFMDVWRKDSLVMFFHHLLTVTLIGFSFAIRYHNIGLLVLFIHDITDVILEFTKLNVYYKNCGGRLRYTIHDAVASIGFFSFAMTWLVFRLYWFPLKVLHAAGYGALVVSVNNPDGRPPLLFFFNVMLWILQILNVYWFLFILQLFYKIATGQMEEVADVREELDEDGRAIIRDKYGKRIPPHDQNGKTILPPDHNGKTVLSQTANCSKSCNGFTSDHATNGEVINNGVSDDVMNGSIRSGTRLRQTKQTADDD